MAVILTGIRPLGQGAASHRVMPQALVMRRDAITQPVSDGKTQICTHTLVRAHTHTHADTD